MRKRTKALVIAAAILVVGAGGAVVLRKALHVPWFPYMNRPLADGSREALAHGAWRFASLGVDPGVELAGLERKPGDPGAPWIVFLGGNSPEFLGEGVRFVDALLAGRDWGASVWAYRSYDGSGGTPSATTLERDASTMLAHVVRDLAVSRERLHVVAFSLGTSLALAASAGDPTFHPASLTLLAPFTELDMRPPGSAAPHRYDGMRYLDAVRCPVLVVHGLRDTTLSPSGSETIATRLGSRARLRTHAELAHLDLPTAPAVLAQVREFIGEHAKPTR